MKRLLLKLKEKLKVSISTKQDNKPKNQTCDLRTILLMASVFWLFFLLFYAVVKLLHPLVFSHFKCIEYWPFEQLSKYYLLLTILISVHSYITQHLSTRIKLSICFLLIGLTMYLSESNMIINNTQPLFGIIILSYTFYLLLKTHEWEVFVFLILGCFAISMGALIDLLHDFINFQRLENIVGLLFEQIPNHLKFSYLTEETFEVVGAGFVCLSIMTYSINSLTGFFKKSKLTAIGFLVVTAMIASGNSFLHWQCKLSREFMAFALALTLMGVLGVIKISQNTNKKYTETIIGLPDIHTFSIFIFSFFYVLPAIFGRYSNTISIFVWFPTLIFLTFFLLVKHPDIIITKNVNIVKID